jgi:hypothetical protein
VDEWSDKATCGSLCQFHDKDSVRGVGLVQSGHHYFIEFNPFSPDIVENKMIIRLQITITHSLYCGKLKYQISDLKFPSARTFL